MNLISGNLSDAPTQTAFSDENLVANMLAFETSLAAVQARLGVIPAGAGSAIDEGLAGFSPDYDGLRAGAERDGFPVAALLGQARAHLGAEAAPYLHWGATTQDAIDTAVVLGMRIAFERSALLLDRLIRSLAAVADAHRHTLMAARTHSQQAVPTTFGLKAAGWLAPLIRHRARLAELRPRVLMLQFGGAAGTLAALGGRGPEIAASLARELGLGLPPLPWHTQRDGIAEAAGWLSMVMGSLAKMAQDVILLGQSEIGEVRGAAAGGSSTMPQKRNPIAAERIVAAARTGAALLGAVHQAGVQEHERGTHGLQVELMTLPQMFALANGALAGAGDLVDGLVVDAGRMRSNLILSNGLMLAEALSFALAGIMDRAAAKALVGDACRETAESGRHLVDVVRERTGADLDWDALRDEANYLGAAQVFIDAVLARVSPEGAK